MSLTSGVLLFLLWVLSVAAFGWLVIRPRATGRGWGAALGRAGYQLLILTTVLLAVGVTLNDQYGWYANWDDLATSFDQSGPGSVVAAGAAAAAAASSSTGGSTDHSSVALKALPSLSTLGLTDHTAPAGGQVRSYTVAGPISRISSMVTVWFPPQYTDPAFADHRFPVLEAFHGAPGTPRQLWYNMSLGRLVAQQTADGNLAPSIVVMPFWTPGQVDNECVDGGAGQPQVEQWLTRDVTNWVEHHLRVANGRGSWATIGLSAGAWCASMLAMLHPDVYAAGISLGGYYQPTFEARYVPFKPHSPQWDHYDLVKVARDHPPATALWLETSKADPVSSATTTELLAATRRPMSVTADVLPNAGHRLGVWVPLIPQTLRWLAATAPGFRPAPALGLPGLGTASPGALAPH